MLCKIREIHIIESTRAGAPSPSHLPPMQCNNLTSLPRNHRNLHTELEKKKKNRLHSSLQSPMKLPMKNPNPNHSWFFQFQVSPDTDIFQCIFSNASYVQRRVKIFVPKYFCPLLHFCLQKSNMSGLALQLGWCKYKSRLQWWTVAPTKFFAFWCFFFVFVYHFKI